MKMEQVETIEIFCVYAQADELFCDELAKHLSSFVQQGRVTIWHERFVGAGENRVQAIERHLNNAHVIVLLVSADFLYSDECMVIAQRALERHEDGDVRVIPLILRAVDWSGTLFAVLQSLPTDGKPVVNWSSRDEAFVDVVQGLRRIIQELSPVQTQRLSVPHHLPVLHEANRPTTVFLSYLQEESAEAQDLQTLLNLRGLRTWHHDHHGNSSAEGRIRAVDQESDVFVIFATSRYLTSDLAWSTEIPAALRRCEHDRHFLIISLLDGVTIAEFQHYGMMRGLPSLANFHSVTLPERGMSGHELMYQRELGSVCKRILGSALLERWQQLKGDRTYEPGLFLQTFPSVSPTPSLDLIITHKPKSPRRGS
jgi:TIR domain